MPKPFEEDDDDDDVAPPPSRRPRSGGVVGGRKTDWLAKIKKVPAPYWVVGLGAGALAIDYLIEKDHSILSAAYRGVFGSPSEVLPPRVAPPVHPHPHGMRGQHGPPQMTAPGMAPGMAPYAAPYAAPGYAQAPTMFTEPSMIGVPGYYPSQPAFYPAVHHRGFPWEHGMRGHHGGHGGFGAHHGHHRAGYDWEE